MRLGRIGACRSTDPLGNLFISARGQTSHWVRLFIYVIEQVAHPRHLLNASVPPDGYLLADMKVALPNMSHTPEDPLSSIGEDPQ